MGLDIDFAKLLQGAIQEAQKSKAKVTKPVATEPEYESDRARRIAALTRPSALTKK